MVGGLVLVIAMRVVVAVSWDCSLVCFSISAICCLWAEGAEISIPRMMSRISDWVSDATFTLEMYIFVKLLIHVILCL